MYQKIVPPQKKPNNDKGYFEILSKAVFNAGFSYNVVNSKWSGIIEVFNGFDPKIISQWTVDDISYALNSPKVIRNSRKINAIISNAQTFLNLVETHGSFKGYLNSFKNESYDQKIKNISSQFKWLGPTGAHFFLWSVGEDVPPCEEVIN